MTGTGTQTDPYVVVNWEEFISVCGIDGCYITCPENSVWDMNEILPDGLTSDVIMDMYEFDGNGLQIKNLYANGGSFVFGSKQQGSHPSFIYGIKFIGIRTALENNSVFRCKDQSNWAKGFKECCFTGVITNGYLFMLPFTCYFNIYAKERIRKGCFFDIVLDGNGVFCTAPTFTCCYIKLRGKQRTNYRMTGKYDKCYFSGISPYDGDYGIEFQNITNSVLDIIVPQGSKIEKSSINCKTCIVNKEKFLGTYKDVINNLYFPIEATTEQLSDAEYLQSKGFSIALEDSQINNNTWFIDENGRLINKFLPIPLKIFESENWGAFANAKNLQHIRIPPTVKNIGKYSFINTQLKSVTIAKDCVYYDTSFPDGCVIQFY